MAYDDTTLKRDGSGITPVPQHFNPIADDYEPIYGRNNAGRVELYGPDGNPISTDDSNKLAVRASEVETLLNDIKGKDFATQTTLAAILAKLIAAPATEAKQDTLIGHVDGVESALASIQAKLIAAPATEAKQDTIIGHVDGIEGALTTLNGKDFATQTTLATLLTKAGFDAKADIALTAFRDAIMGTGSKTLTDLATALAPLATSAKQAEAIAALGAIANAAVTDPAANGTAIALLKGLLSRIQTLENKIDSITDGTSPATVQLSGSNIEEVVSNVNVITSKWKQAQEYDIYGVKWDKGETPTLTRTDDAVGLTANAGVGYESVTNHFDKLPIFGEIEQVEDSLGNVFMKIPKFYCRDTDGASHKQMQVSKRRYPGFYLPCCFWDFTNNKELDYFLVGKHLASLSVANQLESKPNRYPLINTNIVDFRTYAEANNTELLKGYQQNDIHWVNLLQKLMIIEFATLDIQSVMKGYTEGQYASTHLATATETGVNRIIVANAHADLYRVGQAISVGTSQGGNQVFYGRTITAIEEYDADNKAIYFDGDPVDITTGNMLYNSGWKTGFNNQLLASSGSIVANDGKYPCVYRGIESPFGDVWEFVDGLNIDDRQAWICKNTANYASNLFASPYEQLGYVNHDTNGYIQSIGFDPNFPFAQLPTAITGSTTPTQYYGDYYYQDVGQRVALFGGYWLASASAGIFCWLLSRSSSYAYVYFGGRLLKKPL